MLERDRKSGEGACCWRGEREERGERGERREEREREAEKELIVSKFRSNDNNLVSGFVKRVTRDNIIVEINNDVEAILPRDQLLPGEIYKINDRIRAILQIKEIEGRGAQLMMSGGGDEIGRAHV